ncbi:MAG: hypothetical protein A2X86_19555 [Bdellovibrionales bacterium GWA2_49_15]|nr:MAG: hypothetical protein A2X86_19555 [Bdellovibrionales bacterium GWA2_49_15]HAZ13812.1 hypothetical protein [Bdellovibrionales bacterium]
MKPQQLHSPLHYELIQPLVKWKILSLDHLMEATWKVDKSSNFYKTIEALVNKELISSFHDPYSKCKYVYLTNKGYEALGAENNLPINPSTVIHDTFASENAFHFKNFPFTKEVLLDHEILKQYPMIGHRPDALVFGHHKKDFTMAIEMELSIKSKARIMETYSYYSASEFFNNVLYIFGQANAFETYVNILEEEGKALNHSKFLFVYMKNMYRRYYETFNSECYHNGNMTTLGKLFDMDVYYARFSKRASPEIRVE